MDRDPLSKLMNFNLINFSPFALKHKTFRYRNPIDPKSAKYSISIPPVRVQCNTYTAHNHNLSANKSLWRWFCLWKHLHCYYYWISINHKTGLAWPGLASPHYYRVIIRTGSSGSQHRAKTRDGLQRGTQLCSLTLFIITCLFFLARPWTTNYHNAVPCKVFKLDNRARPSKQS